LRAYCRKRPDIQKLTDDAMTPIAKPGGDHGNQHTGGKWQGDNITLPPKSQRGTSRTYTLRRPGSICPHMRAANDRLGTVTPAGNRHAR
jgi:hypothetical protein